MNLSDNFTLDEMTVTEVRSMADQNKVYAADFIRSLQRVCLELLEPVRHLFHDAPINVHSGFRYPALNVAIGGSPTSQHCVGEAADFDIAGQVDQDSLVDALHIIIASEIKFRQLLIENGCLHISLPHHDGNDGEVAYWHAGVKTIIRVGA